MTLSSTIAARQRAWAPLPIMAALLAGAGFHVQAAAWASANRYGGHSEGDAASVSHTNAWGGSTTHDYAGGTTHTSADGATTQGGVGFGAVHTSPDGSSVYRLPVTTAYHESSTSGVYRDAGYDGNSAAVYHAAAPVAYGQPAYAPYRPPAVIAAYTPGCVNCASIVSGGPVVVSGGVAVVRTGIVIPRYPVGVSFATVPSSAIMVERNGVHYYQAGDTWFRPYYAGGGVQYTVVSAP